MNLDLPCNLAYTVPLVLVAAAGYYFAFKFGLALGRRDSNTKTHKENETL